MNSLKYVCVSFWWVSLFRKFCRNQKDYSGHTGISLPTGSGMDVRSREQTAVLDAVIGDTRNSCATPHVFISDDT